MSDNENNKDFTCGTCKQRIPLRNGSHKVVCIQTLDFHDRCNPATCEYAEREEQLPFIEEGTAPDGGPADNGE